MVTQRLMEKGDRLIPEDGSIQARGNKRIALHWKTEACGTEETRRQEGLTQSQKLAIKERSPERGKPKKS